MMLIDHILVVMLTALAASALVWRVAFSHAPPACAENKSAPDVIVSPALARALARAAAKKRGADSKKKGAVTTTARATCCD